MSAPSPSAAGGTSVSPSIIQLLVCGALLVTVSMGIRHGFGLWLNPITTERGWTREHFSIALAIQNIVWGLAGPIAGMLADRWGAWKVIVLGGIAYALGLFGMAWAPTPMTFALTAGVLVGLAQAGTTYSMVYGIIGRNVSADKRSRAMGLTAAAGSFGQFLMVPVEQRLIGGAGWQQALVILGVLALTMLPLAWLLREGTAVKAAHFQQTIGEALREAFAYPSFRWLMAGYFVCGFQVVFIGVHLPAYLKDHGLPPNVATSALMLIGLFNVLGTWLAGELGQKLPRRYILSAIYFLRAIAITVFVLVPLTPMSVYIFSAVIGALWLSTVPPTNAIVAQVFGVQYLTMLSGFVFFSHQVGSFLGVWLGGKLYDVTGSYDVVWWLSVALGLLAALVNLPVREQPIVRAARPAVAV